MAKVSPTAALARATTRADLSPSFSALLEGSGPKGADPSVDRLLRAKMNYDAITMVIEYGVTAIATGFDTDLSGFFELT